MMDKEKASSSWTNVRISPGKCVFLWRTHGFACWIPLPSFGVCVCQSQLRDSLLLGCHGQGALNCQGQLSVSGTGAMTSQSGDQGAPKASFRGLDKLCVCDWFLSKRREGVGEKDTRERGEQLIEELLFFVFFSMCVHPCTSGDK